MLILVLAAFVGQIWAQVMMAYDGNTLREKASYRAEGSGGILYTIRGGIPSFTHENRRGDVIAKTSSTGILTYQAQYQAFGKRTQEQGATLDRQKGCSKDEDPTGLRDEGRRITDLETGSFITEDPAGMIDGPNLYTYVMDNPWTHFDPEGLATEADYQARLKSDQQDLDKLGKVTRGNQVWAANQRVEKDKEGINKIEKTARDLEKATRMAVGSVDGSKLNDSDQSYKEFATTQRLLDFWPGSGIADHAAHGEYAAAAKEFGVNVAESLAVGKLLGIAGKVLSKFAPDIALPSAEVPSSKVLGQNMEAAGTPRPSESAAHHIVAGSDSRAAEARAILQQEGIGINDAENGSFLPRFKSSANSNGAQVHSTVHTGIYYDAVNSTLRNAPKGTARDVLSDINEQLQQGTFPH